MTEEVKLDPRTVARNKARLKVTLRDSLMEVIYGPPHAILQEQLDAILTKNNAWCVSYRGEVYRMANYATARLPLQVPRLSAGLVPAMALWVISKNKLDEEQALSGGALTAVLNAVTDPQDFYKIFPECLHEALKQFLALLPSPDLVRPLTDEQVADIQSRQRQYLSLLQIRLMRTLVGA